MPILVAILAGVLFSLLAGMLVGTSLVLLLSSLTIGATAEIELGNAGIVVGDLFRALNPGVDVDVLVRGSAGRQSLADIHVIQLLGVHVVGAVQVVTG